MATSSGSGEGQSYQIVKRDKTTRKSVLIKEKIASYTITIGGLMVILAVIGIMVFLVQVAAPLSLGGKIESESKFNVQAKQFVWLNADEYRTTAARVAADGRVDFVHLPTQQVLSATQLDFGGERAISVGAVLLRDQLGFGFEDGSVRFGNVGFDVTVVLPSAIPSDARRLNETDFYHEGSVYRVLRENQVRRIKLATDIAEPQKISDFPIVALDYRVGGTAERPTRSFVTFDSQNKGRLSRAEIQRNLLTGAEQVRLRTSELPDLPEGAIIQHVALKGSADVIYVGGGDGMLFRYDARNFSNPTLAESLPAFEDGSPITSMAFLNGELALVVGGQRGEVNVFFRLEDPSMPDGQRSVLARQHEPQGAAITDISVSQRSKALITLDEAGGLWLRHSTSDQVLARFESGGAAGQTRVVLLPRVDGALAVDQGGNVDYFEFDFRHPEATLRAVFGKLWYEGYPEPSFTWQSTAGTDVFEPKYSLIPLIFGTIKATIYAMIFALPIALLAAIYTSEFVHRSVRNTVKPVMEMMESLPTVVVGFIAALILAPIVESWLSAFLLAFVALPLGLMLAAFSWQMLPPWLALRLDGLPKFGIMFLVIILSLYVAYSTGASLEGVLFQGDFKAWVNGDFGTGTPLMFFLLLPLSYFVVLWGFGYIFGNRHREALREYTKVNAGAFEMARFLLMVVTAAFLSYAVAEFLTMIGFDPRGGVVDTYIQRNALVVGLVMGFAVIPTIYTIAEDAMNSVPSHLRSASLASGATPWQTAKWIIIPTAMSGIFAAVMIGMGRAVGETMIVVMAAGNTPVLDWNIFNGMRTLSANIAVELPEAVKDGTNYRMLFLAALTLFIMTFVINTFAEIIRQRFRKRAFQL
jgi:phosphate transport system permease protein